MPRKLATTISHFLMQNTVHEDDRSELQPQQEPAPESTPDILIARTNALTLDDPPCPSKLRPVIQVTNRDTTSIILRSLNPPTLPDECRRFLSDRPSSTSNMKPLILATKRATRHFKLPPPTTTLL
ncbi:uncharacterized protein BJ212DRAFT_1484879 [Suillus subaureus]|uniref:Uncharacterized protein n=1 Tax=Suillus subaureus TaxID=48587 RepID=A0A9P7J8N2_9AGAM|nr:uncharacterized protein BJ212DRAFT_1484879 [Suillus subaureus]KAG1808618.1 hypothetical protein BJ212DRAFT_1484879 [Suillus subaureus]